MPRRKSIPQTSAAVAPTPLRSIRLHEGLTLTKLARLAGLSDRTVRDIERGQRRCREVTLHQIVNALNANPHRIRQAEYTLAEVFPPNQPSLF